MSGFDEQAYIDTCGVLPEEKRATKEEAVGDASVVDDCFEGLPEAETDGGALMLESDVDEVDFFL